MIFVLYLYLLNLNLNEDIWILITEARLIIADVTDRNLNIFYELGITHTLGKDVIIITQNKNDIPFVIQHIRYIQYNDNEDGWNTQKEILEKFTNTISKKSYILQQFINS